MNEGSSTFQVVLIGLVWFGIAWIIVRELRSIRRERRESPIARTVPELIRQEREG